jgi:hypothetical protein
MLRSGLAMPGSVEERLGRSVVARLGDPLVVVVGRSGLA